MGPAAVTNAQGVGAMMKQLRQEVRQKVMPKLCA
jgi:hypothetical protein